MGASSPRRIAAAAALLLGLSAAFAPAQARDKDDIENKLRGALRSATVRLRELEDQNATLQAKQAETDRELQALKDKSAADDKELDELRQHGKADQEALQRSAARIENTEATLAKWQAAYKDAADTARARDADAKRLDAEVKRLDAEGKLRDSVLGRARERTDSCEAKNAELFKIGEELIALYEKKGFVDVLEAHEPVTQLKSVEYENMMQDYEDKLRANKVEHPAPTGP